MNPRTARLHELYMAHHRNVHAVFREMDAMEGDLIAANARVKELESTCSDWLKTCATMRDRVSDIERQLAEARNDSERIDKLHELCGRPGGVFLENDGQMLLMHTRNGVENEINLRAVIDAARKEQQ